MKKTQSLYKARVIRLKKCIHNTGDPDLLELWLVLCGEVIYTDRFTKRNVCKNNFILSENGFNSSLETSGDGSVLLAITFSLKELSRILLKNWQPVFHQTKLKEMTFENKQKIISILVKIGLEYFVTSEEDTTIKMYKEVFSLLEILEGYTECRFIESTQEVNPTVHHPIVKKMLDYVNYNYQSKISLRALSEKEFLSEAYMSRLFKQNVGVNFSDYVTQKRLSKAEIDLRHSDLSITSIALNNGFPSGKRFSKVFKEKNGVLPSEYLDQLKQKSKGKTVCQFVEESFEILSNHAAFHEISKFMIDGTVVSDMEELQLQHYDITLIDESLGQFNSSKGIVTIGSFENFENMAVVNQLELCQKNNYFTYVRFNVTLEVVRQKKYFISTFKLRNILNLLRQYHLKPIFLLSVSTREPPEDLLGRLDFIKYLVQLALQDPDGKINDWRIELHYNYAENHEEIALLYQKVQYYVKTYMPFLSIGVTISDFGLGCQQSVYEFFRGENGTKFLPAFFSLTLSYPLVQEFSKKGDYEKELDMKSLLENTKKQLSDCFADEIDSEWFVSEWGTYTGKEEKATGAYFRAGIIVKQILSLLQIADGIGFWLNGESDKMLGDRSGPASLSMFLFEDIRRPLFYIWKFIKRLDGEILLVEEHVMITKNADKYSLLCFTTDYLEHADSTYANLWYTYHRKISLTFNNLPYQKCLIKSFLLDKNRGGIYNQWFSSGTELNWDNDVHEYLALSTIPQLKLRTVELETGRFTEVFHLSVNACCLVEIMPIAYKITL